MAGGTRLLASRGGTDWRCGVSFATTWKNLTTDSMQDMTYSWPEWIRRSRQIDKRHPLTPLGVCASCGDSKLGYWKWEPYEPDEH